MLISIVSLQADPSAGLSSVGAAGLPGFGALNRLGNVPSLPSLGGVLPQAPAFQMQSMLGAMVLLLQALMGGANANASGVTAAPAAASSAAPASTSSAPTTDLSNVKGTEFGKKFAAQAEKTANGINTPGWCLKGVNDTMQAMGIPVKREASAYMALDDFQNNPRFQQVNVSKDQLKSLPAGAVVVWDKGPKNPHGHISVALGDGREASSVVRPQLTLSTNFHVFLPKE